MARVPCGMTDLLELLKAPDAYPLFVTGAGISLASGIPTFRGTDPGAVWANDVIEKGTNLYFQRDPAASWVWYLQRFEACLNAEPNPAHKALVDIETRLNGRCMVVTQNVDGLHLKAGSKNVVEVHGSSRKMRCSRRGCANGAPNGTMSWDIEAFTAFKANPSRETVPRCPVCRKLIRAHVLWFDEGYTGHKDYGFNEALDAVDRATVVVFVGTSFSVMITELIEDAALIRNLPLFSVDPGTEPAHARRSPIRERAEEFLPALAAALG